MSMTLPYVEGVSLDNMLPSQTLTLIKSEPDHAVIHATTTRNLDANK